MNTKTVDAEVIEPGEFALAAVNPDVAATIARVEIDTQIATAHQYPRSMAEFKRRAMEMVTLDEETAQSCIFRRPVGKKKNEKTGKWEVEYAEGKSIRMAEIVGASYGNLRVGAMLVEQTPRYVKARGMAHDLESNFAASSEVVESTVDRNGQPYSERMRMVVAKATLAKARRDATFQVVPGALCKSLEEAARTTAIGTTATLGKRRSLVLDWINKVGVDKERVFAALGVGGIEDIGLAELETLTGIRTAIKEKETTLDDAFPPLSKDGAVSGENRAESLARKLKPEPIPPTEAEPTAPVNPPGRLPTAPPQPPAASPNYQVGPDPEPPIEPAPGREPGEDDLDEVAGPKHTKARRN